MSLRFIQNTLYRLKRRYGSQVKLQYRGTISNDYETGTSNIVFNGVTVRKAIVLPDILSREVLHNLTFMGINTGGYSDVASRFIIIDCKDIKIDITPDFWVIFENKRWNVKSAQLSSHNLAYFIKVTAVSGPIKNEMFDNIITQSLIIEDTYALQ